jgi:cellulose synthase/poly-beta-1,6-N-acetylglucosamine synthase-like glycosyltransferase
VLTARAPPQVLVPCYKEGIEVVEATLRAVLMADLPHTTTRTVYLCDDGKDPQKEYLCRCGVRAPGRCPARAVQWCAPGSPGML